MKLTTLTVRQPFASAILAGLKVREYRSWRTSHRGLLGVHAAKSVRVEMFAEYPILVRADCPVGAVIGVVEVEECKFDDALLFWAWTLVRPRVFSRPVPMTGRLGLWTAEVADELLR